VHRRVLLQSSTECDERGSGYGRHEPERHLAKSESVTAREATTRDRFEIESKCTCAP
jgi:hypothetical protein